TREIGLLRAIGLARRQLRRMIRLESVVIAVFGAVLGLALGLVWGVCTQQVLALQGMTAFAVPWGTIVLVVVGSAVVGIAAALLPALRASRTNVLEAIAHDGGRNTTGSSAGGWSGSWNSPVGARAACCDRGMNELRTRAATAADVDAVLAFWKVAAEGTSISDDRTGVERLVARDPEALILAEQDG